MRTIHIEYIILTRKNTDPIGSLWELKAAFKLRRGTSIIITNTIFLYLSCHKEGNLITFSMRTTVNYMHMRVLSGIHKYLEKKE